MALVTVLASTHIVVPILALQQLEISNYHHWYSLHLHSSLRHCSSAHFHSSLHPHSSLQAHSSTHPHSSAHLTAAFILFIFTSASVLTAALVLTAVLIYTTVFILISLQRLSIIGQPGITSITAPFQVHSPTSSSCQSSPDSTVSLSTASGDILDEDSLEGTNITNYINQRLSSSVECYKNYQFSMLLCCVVCSCRP